MIIAVCVKQTPVATADRRLDSGLLLDRDNTDSAMNTYDEMAVEEALRIRDETGGSIVALSVGPAQASDTLRRALAMGVDTAVLVSDPALRGSDVWATSLVVARALGRLQADLILLGLRSDDAGTGVLAPAIAERLDLPLLSNANKLILSGGVIRSYRRNSDGFVIQEATLPAVVAVTDVINAPRYPSLKGIMAAKRKPLDLWTLEDLDLDASQVGAAGSRTRVVRAIQPPPRGKGTIIVDSGDGADRIVSFLNARRVI